MSEQNQVRIIEVVPYNPNWIEDYAKESSKIKNILGNEIIKITFII